MDEPTANLDPESSKTVRDFILDLKKEKKTIFLNTHNLDEAQRICDRIAILNTKLMALGTPAELERSISGRKTVVQLEGVSQAIISAVKRITTGAVEAEGNNLIIEVNNPEQENPDIVNAIGSAGGRIQFVTEASSTLEDVYLKLVRSQ
jgi:ABC-2 type transport system ATP-binding protein